MTDHANSFDQATKEIDLRKVKTGKVGYESYLNECTEFTRRSNGKIVYIPGAEFGDERNGNSHFLALGLFDATVFRQALQIYNTKDQAATIEFLANRGVVIIAAHADLHWRLPSGRDVYYRFNEHQVNKTTQITGYGLFNNGNMPDDTLRTNIEHMEGKDVQYSIVADCDRHSDKSEHIAPLDPRAKTPDALKRVTVIWAQSNAGRDVIEAIRLHHSAAMYRSTHDVGVKYLPLGYCGGLTTTVHGLLNPYNYVFQFDRPVTGTYYTVLLMSVPPHGQVVAWPKARDSRRSITNNQIEIRSLVFGRAQAHILIASVKISPTKHYILVGSPWSVVGTGFKV
jgi:hypothetical protein